MKKKIGRIVVPIFIAGLIIFLQYASAQKTEEEIPYAKEGILNLDDWNKAQCFLVVGECEFYWNQILTPDQIEAGTEISSIVYIPSSWNYYKIEGIKLSGIGQATYHLHVTGADTNEVYGIRIPNASTAYKLFIDSDLLAQSGNFEDTESTPISGYVYKTVSFTPSSSEFEITLQMSNNCYYLGGLSDSILFGTYAQVSSFHSLLSNINNISFSMLILICLLFLIIFLAQKREKDLIILVGFGIIAMIRLAIFPNSGISLAVIWPNMTINSLIKLDYFTIIWAPFLFVFFVYSTYGTFIKKWHLLAVLVYSIFFTIYLILPNKFIYPLDSAIYFVAYITVFYSAIQLGLAVWMEQDGAILFFTVLSFYVLYILYYSIVFDYSLSYFIFLSPAYVILILFIIQFVNVAHRYSRAQKIEMSAYKNQIHPYFFNNSLAGIINVAQKDPSKSRDLLINMSSYLHGFYDYLDDDFITLNQELELVNAYITLNNMSFSALVNVNYNLEVSNIMLPPLILEPLVENAFLHGLRKKENGGEIIIYTKRLKNELVKIGVKDNGIGIKESKKSTDHHEGVGIKNINLRLRKLYRTQLIFETPEGGGCDVYMEIPLKEIPE